MLTQEKNGLKRRLIPPAVSAMAFAFQPRPRRISPGRAGRHARKGKVLVLLAVSVPAIFAIAGLVFDAGMLMTNRQNLQQAADAAATAAAMDLLLGKSTASTTATNYFQSLNGFANAQVTTNIPPQSGPYAGQAGFVEVIGTFQYTNQIMQIVGAASQSQITVRAVSGYEASTAGAAVVVLDPLPAPVAIGPIPSIMLPSYPALTGGLEVLGLGSLSVNGAVLVNNTWGGVDQNGNPAGSGPGPPYGISCTPLLSLTSLLATDIRVVGGVDKQTNYASIAQGSPSPLKANALTVPDPYEKLPVPCTATDPANVNTTTYGGVQVIQLPLLVAPTTLHPGVYDWIEIVSGSVIFAPGIYIIRGANPITGISLSILAGTVTANGVLFYITNSTTFDPVSGAPDSADGDTRPPTGNITQLPSVVINSALPGGSFSPLAAGSPFDGMLIYQRRMDSNPIVVYANLPGDVPFQGAVYAKWAHFLFSGTGTLNLSITAGTARIIPVGSLTLKPTKLLSSAFDVFLVE